MRYLIYISILFLPLAACERQVEIENPYPIKAKYCQVNDTLLGNWGSDSVWVVTQVDSLDSIIINTRPTYFYDLKVKCDEDTNFLLEYINYGGVVTREFYSNNFGSSDTSILLYDELDFDRNTPSYEINYDFSSDSAMLLNYFQQLNSDQRTEIFVWLKRQ